MVDPTKRAARKLNPEPGSWSKDAIERKAFRQMSPLPEEESIPHRRARPTRKRHVHKWTPWAFQRETVWYSWWRRKRMTTRYYLRSCERCGTKEQRIDTTYLYSYIAK